MHVLTKKVCKSLYKQLYVFSNYEAAYQWLKEEKLEYLDDEERSLTDYYVYVPLPFNIGDKVKITLETGSDYYGAICDNYDKRERRRFEICNFADEGDMLAAVAVYDEKKKEWWFSDASPVLDVRYATEEECKNIPDLPSEII